MRLTRTRMAGAAAALVVLLSAAVWIARSGRHAGTADALPSWRPLPHAVRIEVLNAGAGGGAARVGTIVLRHAGLDVVQSGNADSTQSKGIEQNRILVRRGDTTGVGRIIEALGGAEVVDTPAPNRLVDLTVLLGKKFAPPPDRVTASQ